MQNLYSKIVIFLTNQYKIVITLMFLLILILFFISVNTIPRNINSNAEPTTLAEAFQQNYTDSEMS